MTATGPILRNRENKDTVAEMVVEGAKILGILGGIGAVPLLHDAGIQWFWAVGMIASFLVLAASAFYLIRHALRTYDFGDEEQSLWRKVGHLLRHKGRRFWQRVRQRIRQPAETIEEETAITEQGRILIVPYLNILIGIFILATAVTAFFIQRSRGVMNPQLVEIYFGAPALLLWIVGEGIYFYPHFLVRPKHLPQIFALLKSILQVISALFLWVFLGLSIGMDHNNWMLWFSLITAVLGALVGLLAIRLAKRPQQAEHKLNTAVYTAK